MADPGEALFLHLRYSPEVRADDKLLPRLDTFLDLYGFARKLAFDGVTQVATRRLQPHFSPGSVRELESVLEEAMMLKGQG